MIKISLTGEKEAKAKFSSARGKEALEEGLQALVKFGENRIGLNASTIVYGYKPKTNKYVRKGFLLGGRGGTGTGRKPNRLRLNSLAYELEANPQLKGAKFNYAPYVNSGKGWMKRVGPRPFWDVSVKEIQSEAPRFLKEAINNKFK
jgi:hypothetical protein